MGAAGGSAIPIHRAGWAGRALQPRLQEGAASSSLPARLLAAASPTTLFQQDGDPPRHPHTLWHRKASDLLQCLPRKASLEV